MKKQIKFGIISLVVTLVVLVAGYQGYQQWFVKKPLVDLMQNQNGISVKNIQMNKGNIQIQLQVSPRYPFISQFPEVTDQLDKMLGQGNWLITFLNPNKTQLQSAWQEMIFGVMEGIQLKRYTLLQNTVERTARKYHLSYGLTMDDQYVYLVLRNGKQNWYQLLPLRG